MTYPSSNTCNIKGKAELFFVIAWFFYQKKLHQERQCLQTTTARFHYEYMMQQNVEMCR